ncbi:MAG: stage II sporulation protein D [Firmicutes bacterium]|nr:stage II sporulation protein D [Bacillota bacterium]
MFRRLFLFALGALFFTLLLLPALLVRGCFLRPPAGGGTGTTIVLYHAATGRLLRLGLEEYLVGVLAAEVPAAFHLEALKAQAVAARTMAIKRMKRFGGPGCRHSPAADLCDRPEDGQAWLSAAELRRKWGWRYPWLYARLARAVEETRGLILLYAGRPIEAVYHSTCGGRTEDATAVWGRAFPYLVSVCCGYDLFSPRLHSTRRLSWQEAARRLGLAGKVTGPPRDLAILARTPSGRVATLRLWGRVLRGPAARAVFGLRSTDFSVRAQDEDLIFTVRGNGHGVGLCQYGAEGMARQGVDFRRILRHYYPGVQLGRLRLD